MSKTSGKVKLSFVHRNGGTVVGSLNIDVTVQLPATPTPTAAQRSTQAPTPPAGRQMSSSMSTPSPMSTPSARRQTSSSTPSPTSTPPARQQTSSSTSTPTPTLAPASAHTPAPGLETQPRTGGHSGGGGNRPLGGFTPYLGLLGVISALILAISTALLALFLHL